MPYDLTKLFAQYLPGATAAQQEQLSRYYALLTEWNERVNLTAITEPEAVMQKHFLDSCMADPFLKKGARCIDVGTGAGFPGIVLCVFRPDVKMTLLDSLGKRVRFLEAVTQALGIPARCVHGRAEDAARKSEHRGRYDAALSRAVAPLPVLLELTTPFLRPGGLAIAYKGPAAEEEAAASKNACSALKCNLRVEPVAAAYGERRLAIAEKIGPVPEKYPRKAGEPGRRPL